VDPGRYTVTITATLKATEPGAMANNVAVNAATEVEKPPTAGVETKVLLPPTKPAAKPSSPPAKAEPPGKAKSPGKAKAPAPTKPKTPSPPAFTG
jgi:hypothetical protein